MTPYLASFEWWVASVGGSSFAPHRGRWNRTMVRFGEWLTIPVQGGISTIKRVAPEQWLVDDSRAWRRNHIGAINAALGRTPFFNHYATAVTDIIADKSFTGVRDIAGAINAHLTDDLRVHDFLREANSLTPAEVERIRNYGLAIMPPEMDSHMALLSFLCRFGPDTIFLLYSALLNRLSE